MQRLRIWLASLRHQLEDRQLPEDHLQERKPTSIPFCRTQDHGRVEGFLRRRRGERFRTDLPRPK